jgi:hypothetical protein
MNDEFGEDRYASLENPTAAYPREQLADLIEASDDDSADAGGGSMISAVYVMVALFGGTLLAVGLAGLIMVVFYLV